MTLYCVMLRAQWPIDQRLGFMKWWTPKNENRPTGGSFHNRRYFLTLWDTATGEASMTTLHTTVIMKTDISGSTVRFRALSEVDLHALLIEHRAFLSRHAAAHDGRIVKPEGDGFWLVFPSVTAAARAAMGMQEELRLAQP